MSLPGRTGVVELAAQVRSGARRARDVVEATLVDLAARDPRAHAFVTVCGEDARADAATVDAAVARESAGPLAGVPIAVKDLIAVRGVVRTNGCTVFRDDPPQPADATVVARLRAAGAIVIGTSHMHEMALGPTGVNPSMGTPVNPWSAERVPGGSSSGSGVAVGAGLVPAALGSDTGGSIRLPAAFCGATGMKPTYGRVSRAGVTPLAWSLDHVGPLTRSAADAAAVLQAIAGHDPGDPASAALPVPDFAPALGRSVRGWRIGVLRTLAAPYLDVEVAASFDDAARRFTGMGAVVRDVAFEQPERARVAFGGMIMAEACATLTGALGPRLADASIELTTFVGLGRALQARHYLAAQRQRAETYAAVRRLFDDVDLLLLPTTVCPPPRPDDVLLRVGDAERSAMEAIAWFTWLYDFTGLPAASVPCGFTTGGLPIGLQIAGRAFADADVLTAAHAYQRETDWHLRRPPG